MECNPFLSAQDMLLSCAAYLNILVCNSGRLIAGKWRQFYCSTIVNEAISFLPRTILINSGGNLFWAADYCSCVMNWKDDGQQFIVAHSIGLSVCHVAFVLFPTTMVRPEAKGSTTFDLLVKLRYRLNRTNNLLPSPYYFVSRICWICCSNLGKRIQNAVVARKELC